jgi:hypothetical protein
MEIRDNYDFSEGFPPSALEIFGFFLPHVARLFSYLFVFLNL